MIELEKNRSDFRFFHRLRVRWAEVDMQKIVFNAHYLMYFDTAIADYWRALALPYEESMAALGGDLYVKKATIEFNASARMDDVLDVAMKCVRVGNSSIVFHGGLFRGDELLVSCELIYVFADPATQTSRPVPDELRAIFAAYEAGEPMARSRPATGRSSAAVPAGCAGRCSSRSSASRRTGMGRTRRDRAACRGPQPPGPGDRAPARLMPRGARPGPHRTDGGAPHAARRRARRGVLRALEAAARARGDREVTLHAQRSAEAFYTRLGYVPAGALSRKPASRTSRCAGRSDALKCRRAAGRATARPAAPGRSRSRHAAGRRPAPRSASTPAPPSRPSGAGAACTTVPTGCSASPAAKTSCPASTRPSAVATYARRLSVPRNWLRATTSWPG